jgi:hypothetical protein
VDLTNVKNFAEIWAEAFPRRNIDPVAHLLIRRLVKVITERAVWFALSYDDFVARRHDVLVDLKISEAEFAEVEGEIAALKTDMTHAASLRVIGQSLEVAKLPTFELGVDGTDYIVRSDSLNQTGEWILRHALSPNKFSDQSTQRSSLNPTVRFRASDLSRLDDQARKQRRIDFAASQQTFSRLSQLLRALGDYLDQTRAGAFHISWDPAAVTVDFQAVDGQNDSRSFTVQKLEQLGGRLRFRRSRIPHRNENPLKKFTDR